MSSIRGRRLIRAVALTSATGLVAVAPAAARSSDGPLVDQTRASAGAARVHDPGPTHCDRVGRKLVGMRVRAAEKRAIDRGCLFRVVIRDGKRLAVTDDHLHLRINVRVADGVVRKVVGLY